VLVPPAQIDEVMRYPLACCLFDVVVVDVVVVRFVACSTSSSSTSSSDALLVRRRRRRRRPMRCLFAVVDDVVGRCVAFCCFHARRRLAASHSIATESIALRWVVGVK